jgi:hypothetical protein
MKRATMSFDEKREAIMRAAAEKEAPISKQASLENNEVPSFLEELQRFEEDSRARRIRAR